MHHTPTTTTILWVLMELLIHKINTMFHQDLTLQPQHLMGSLLQCLVWKTSPLATHLNHNPLPPTTRSPHRAQAPKRSPLLLHHPFPQHPTPSIPRLRLKMPTVPVTPCHIHLVTQVKCQLTVTPREGPPMDRASRLRAPISSHKIPRSSSNSNNQTRMQGLAEEKPTKTKTRNRDNSCGTA